MSTFSCIAGWVTNNISQLPAHSPPTLTKVSVVCVVCQQALQLIEKNFWNPVI